MQVNVRVIGVEELRRKLANIQNAARDMSKFWGAIGKYMRDRTITECFDKEQSPDGVKWAPWSEKYRRRMEKAGKGGNKILTNTSDLRRSIGYNAFKDSVVVSANSDHAKVHQFGDAKRNIPARPFLGVTEADREEIKRCMKMYFDRAAK